MKGDGRKYHTNDCMDAWSAYVPCFCGADAANAALEAAAEQAATFVPVVPPGTQKKE